MKIIKRITFSVLILALVMFTCYSLLPFNLPGKALYAVEEIIGPPPKAPVIPG